MFDSTKLDENVQATKQQVHTIGTLYQGTCVAINSSTMHTKL